MALKRGEGQLTSGGAFLAITSPFTGRSPANKFVVKDPSSEDKVWWGKVNKPISPEHYARLEADVKAYLNTKELFVRDLYACANPRRRLNVRPAGDTALFFGLSGTGKATLSADHRRGLIGDDEHGWGNADVFNFEGGCYAKVIRLSSEAEPEIYGTLSMFGTVLENVVMDEETRQLDLDSEAITENTRAAYPIHYIPNYVASGIGNHPRNILFLTADAFGVLPPISRVTPEQALYYF